MAPKEPNKHQLSSRLSYQKTTPAFLLKFQNRVKGITTEEDEPQYEDDGYYHDGGEGYYDDGSGRPPIPQRPRDERPAIPERPDDEPGSADEDDMDEKPQVVVLKTGKHLTEWEAENVRRKERGLAPLPDPNAAPAPTDKPDESVEKSKKKAKDPHVGLSFSSSGSSSAVKSRKRKVIDTDPDFENLKESVSGKKEDDAGKAAKKAKKPKKEKKTLLSFGDDA